MEPLLINWLATLGVVQVAMILLWLRSLPIKDASIVDSFWGPGYAIVAAACLLFPWTSSSATLVLLVSMTGIWGLRLGWHIWTRNHGNGEDFRYREWREEEGARFWWTSLFKVFLFQGLLISVISLPVQIVASGGRPLDPAAITGLVVWAIGLAFEAIGDWQLRQFKADPDNAGKVMDKGLWRYTRHPNYFGDSLVWWGISIVAMGSDLGAWGLLSPILMTVFLTRISGVPMLEKNMIKNKPGYQEYVERTSAFVPLPPKNAATALLIVAITFGATGVGANTFSDRYFPERKIINGNELVLAGSGVYRYLGVIKVFAAGHYVDPRQPVQPLPDRELKALEIVYFHDIDAGDFADVTIRGIRKVAGDQALEQLSREIQAFNSLYRDIQSGDRYTLKFEPGRGTTLYHNGQRLGTVRGDQFARALFGIWLSDSSMDDRLRERLLPNS